MSAVVMLVLVGVISVCFPFHIIDEKIWNGVCIPFIVVLGYCSPTQQVTTFYGWKFLISAALHPLSKHRKITG